MKWVLRRRKKKTAAREDSPRYNEWSYWRSRSDPNNRNGWDEEQRQRDIEYIRRYTSHDDDVLEFGPGVGRTLEAYYGRAKISGYDITGNYEHDLQRRAREIGLGVDLTVAKEAE